MSADPSVKTVQISNDAAESLSPRAYEESGPARGGAKSRKVNRNRKIMVTRESGGAMSPGTLDQLVSSRVPGSDSSQAVGASSKMTEGAAAIGVKSPAAVGGAEVEEPKVHLAKTQKKSKVVLAPSKKSRKVKVGGAIKKPVKLVKMNLSGFTRKLKKASGIHKSAKEKTMDEIKATLVKMELVNKDTKAPEDVLRQIYSDVETMKKRAL
jgi:hypothetical protein